MNQPAAETGQISDNAGNVQTAGRARGTRLFLPACALVLMAGCASQNQMMQQPQTPSMPTPSSMPPSRPSTPSMPSSSPSMPSQSPSRPTPSSPSMPTPSQPSASGSPSPPSAQPPGSSSDGDASAQAEASASDASAAGGASELEVLEPEEAEASADASAEPTWDEGESGGEESLADSEEAAASAGGSSGGEESLADDSASADAAGGPAGGAPGGGEPSSGEMISASGGIPGSAAPAGTEESLEAELNSSLEIFEGEMERTITILASNDDADGESAGGAGGTGGDDEEPGGPFDQTGEGAELVLVNGDPSLLPGGSDEADGERGSEPVTGRPGLEGGGTANETYPRIPGDVGDGQDDDVVARQIREAAMNEDDPALREKLWEEYRNYKKSIQ